MAYASDKRRSVDDILGFSGGGFNSLWETTAAAGDDFDPIPPGTYRCLASNGGLQKAATGTASYRLEFLVLDGPHANRRVWHHCWLTRNALAMSKRDLAKLGIHRPDQLENPPPTGLIFEVKVGLRAQDNGPPRNEVAGFKPLANATSAFNADADDLDPQWSVDTSFPPPDELY